MKRLLLSFRRNNRGFGVVTVLVTLFFVAALGAAMLFLSFTGYQIKNSERKSKQNFYSADTAMQQIRTGVEQAVTESLSSAYTDVLENYSDLNGEYEDKVKAGDDLPGDHSLNAYLENQFQSNFQDQMLSWSDDDSNALFLKHGADQYDYSPEVLLGFLDTPAGATKTVDEASGIYRLKTDSATVNLSCDDSVAFDAKDLRLKGITLTYTASNGYETNITTDITISYPAFSYTPAAYSVTDLSQFAMIAKNELTCSAANLTLTGNAYAGTVSVDAAGAALTSENTLVCGGDIQVDHSASLTASGNSSLWAKSITVGTGTVSLSGNTYVADDLTLAGEQAKAVLAGRYYGFGYPSNENDTGSTSSILINGRDTSLDLGGLTSLMLAGNSFIDTTGANANGGKYRMGQSVAARSDQLAYLVPAACLPDGISSNPCLVTTTIGSDVLSSVMNKVETLETEYPCFQYVDGVKDVYVNLNSTGTDQVAYLFFTFSSQDRANQYFESYYSQHASEIDEYLAKYLSFYRASPSVLSGGNTYSGSVDSGTVTGDGLAAPTSADTLAKAVSQYKTQYANLCETLSPGISSSAANPYDYVINSSLISGLPDAVTEFRDQNGNTEAVIVKGNDTIDSDTLSRLPDLKIVIAAGTGSTVTVSKDFNGLVISEGNIVMNASVNSSGDVSAALQATDSNGQTLLSFTNIGSKTGGSVGEADTGSWDVDTLVSWTGWYRH